MLRRRVVAIGSALALTLAVIVALPPAADAGIVDLECSGDDSVLAGSLGGAPVPSQTILDILGAQGTPPTPPPNTIDAQVSITTDPASYAPGEGEYDFYFETLLDQDLLDTAAAIGITEIEIKNAEFTVEAGLNVEGAPVVADVPDFTIDLTGGVPDTTQGPFTGTFDVTGETGDKVTFDLTSAELGFSTSFLNEAPPPPRIPISVGMSCAIGSGAAVAGLVVNPNGPVTPSYSEETPVNTPVSTDIAAGVTDGPAAPTDFSTLKISSEPVNGSVELVDGVATYTPDTGFTGEDEYRYEVCTEEFDTVEGLNQITQLTVDATGGDYVLQFDDDTDLQTAPIAYDANAAAIKAAIEVELGTGSVEVTDVSGAQTPPWVYEIEFIGVLAETVVLVDVLTVPPPDEANLDGSASASRLQDAVPEEIGVVCNQGLVTITVTPEAAETTTTPVAAPQAVAPTFTG